MTIILIAAGFFALGLTVVLLFRNTIRADDELDRRWAEVVAQRSTRGAPQAAPEEAPEPAEPS
ncbi:MAG: hypothetical protein OXI39_01920 [Gemmatimonadota bacterium]|uniref:hypothetical protein n=1 Tax=Candidatus Palauibacter scopulicola TaxID=3056741 RepID=UPI002398904E|nr:hypothetical protein [Candidatus Palauibacter scopulicola]MDE2661746.1 hypothetical protein [Candidatus Palauibacter scopulicola]